MPRLLMFLGIDVAKDFLDIAVRPTGEEWRVATDEVGITAWSSGCELCADADVLEATARPPVAAVGALTGRPARAERSILARCGTSVSATGKLAKTDAFDVRVLAHLADLVCPASGLARCANTGAEYAVGSPPPARRNADCGSVNTRQTICGASLLNGHRQTADA